MAAWSEPHLNVGPELPARGVRGQLTVTLHRFRGTAEVREVRIAAAEVRPPFQIAAAQRDPRRPRASNAVDELLRDVVAERQLAQLPVRNVLVVNARNLEVRVGAPLA